MTPGAGKDMLVKEGERVEIKCHPPEGGSMIVWFRVLDKSGMEFIASFSNNGLQKSNTAKPSSAFSYTKILQYTVILESFNKANDNGLYSCASLRNSELKFGQVTRLVGGEFCFTNLVQWWSERHFSVTLWITSFFSLKKKQKKHPPSLPPPNKTYAQLPRHVFVTTITWSVNVLWVLTIFIFMMLWRETGSKWAHALQGKPVLHCFVLRSFWAHWSPAVAFFFYSSSSPSCTAIVSPIQSVNLKEAFM